MRDYNIEPTYMQVHSSRIYSDPTYQRPIDKKRVKAIVDKFDPTIVNPIKVSERDGAYWVFDGQHTLAALILRNGGEDLFVQCAVSRGLTREDEAYLFSRQTGESRGVKANLRLRALYLSGDKTVVNLYNTLEKIGIRFDFTEYQGPCKIVACATIYKIFLSLSEKEFVNMMQTILKAWPDSPERLSKEMLNGMYYFFSIYKGEFDIKKAVSQFSKMPPKFILQQGKSVSRGGDKRYTRELVKLYNYNLRNRLDEYKLDI